MRGKFIFCDICRCDITDDDNRYYIWKLHRNMYSTTYKKIKVDMCQSCYEKFLQFVKKP